ncbi:hypothetical protein N0V93_001671 [Gnomoniopsis smithogilvyi]|uniref:Isoleucine--tRNA ligase, cytoplasmic n=1 Tax=Gnomoniopsis smithogilvyi TaxID=1191159 RepID=A0A9W9D1W5_9PEZI|nr:hypothetical protein N0V93_001671 [Gnomoniopsis smithogilvyi]
MNISFPQTEENILRLWKEIDAFQTQMRLTEGNYRFIFYDGPPFGLPHYGHLLTSTIKDIIPRYWSMKGYHVVRRFGWDTHGVPIEYEIDKKLGMSGRDAVKQLGLEKYNSECRAIVMRYAEEWRQIIERLGRWVDFDNDYKSMNATFMESCWWVFKQLFEKQQVYRAYQIMPFSTALCTPLSQMEAKENEKMTQDPAILVAFPVLESGTAGFEGTSLVIYTTTPWTLPSNLFIAAHPEFEYSEIFDLDAEKKYLLLEHGISMLYKDPSKANFKITRKIAGSEMAGWKYEPLFPYFSSDFSDCFQVIMATYVEADEGTGLVHQAPAFGQEDYDAAKTAGFISSKRLPPCPVTEKGEFTPEVSDYAGLHVKIADKAIIKDLRSSGRLLMESQVNHVDKFCWRSDTQLIRRAVSSWFIRVTDSTPDLLQSVESTTWVPSFVKDKRFGNWISGAHDWNVSRNRYWGTPLPLWVSDDYEEIVCVGSIAELRKLSGFTGPLDDIHKDKVDHITIPSKTGKGQLKRVEEVFDCWFESGSMPYASNHYPFENSNGFTGEGRLFPADFIAEGLDQTRGWFYTLSIIGYHLFGKSPFRNVIVNGLVLAEDGRKMSKSLKNYPDPTEIIRAHGSDALRLYLINSPVVRAEPLRFKESGVKDGVSKILLPLWNSYRFFYEQTVLFRTTTGQEFVAHALSATGTNTMDRWILANCQSMLRFIDEEMRCYRLYTVVPRLLSIIDDLTNWYIRFNRKRLKGLGGIEDTRDAMNTLCHVLFILLTALAPFTPFITEHMYGLLRPYLSELLQGMKDTRSVHFLPYPTVQESLFDKETEMRVTAMQNVIQLGRTARERSNVTLKTPLHTVVVIADKAKLSKIDPLQSYIREELNVRHIILASDDEQGRYNILLSARVDWPTLGKKLKKNVQVIRKALPGLSQEQLRRFQVDKKMTISGIELEESDLSIVRVLGSPNPDSDVDGASPHYEAAFSDEIIVLLDTARLSELVDDGLARDIVNRMQRMRKKAGLVPTDAVLMQYRVMAQPEDSNFEEVVETRQGLFESALRGKLVPAPADDSSGILEEDHMIGEFVLKLRLAKL